MSKNTKKIGIVGAGMLSSLTSVIHQNTRSNDLHCINDEKCQEAMTEFLESNTLQFPQVYGFDDYHEIATTATMLNAMNPKLDLRCSEYQFRGTKYWGIFYKSGKRPSDHEIEEMVQRKMGIS